MNIVAICTRIIEFSFYSLFLLVPLWFDNDTSELFELNKMWLTWGLTIVIMTAWISKMIAHHSLRIQKTPLDIFIVLFLSSQLISTIFSLDTRVSLWGYYSRFNGGFLSLLSYVFLFYAFVSNLGRKEVIRSLLVSLFSGLLVTLWGLPSHFGYDPTCLLFRGTYDVTCWTDAFKPTVRVFSSLGQPAWMAAYLSYLLPIAIAFVFFRIPKREQLTEKLPLSIGFSSIVLLVFLLARISHFGPYFFVALCVAGVVSGIWYITKNNKSLTTLSFLSFGVLIILFYLLLLYTNTRAGFIAFWTGSGIFWALLFLKKLYPSLKIALFSFFTMHIVFVLLSFFTIVPIVQLQPYTYSELKQRLALKQQVPQEKTAQQTPSQEDQPVTETNITDSGNIRRIVWKGAIDIWKASPIFGTGVETFAYAYYRYRPVEHNMTSEWDFLYNKAHNEYLNYLATTGLFGLGTYLIMIAAFLFVAITKTGFAAFVKIFRGFRENRDSIDTQDVLLTIALMSGYITILITNFFGFSVVIMNLYLFLTPAFVFLLKRALDPNHAWQIGHTSKNLHFSSTQTISIVTLGLFACFLLYLLLRFWQADIDYALGYNLNRVNQFREANPYLEKAVSLRSAEPVFQDELAYNQAANAILSATEKNNQEAQAYAKQALLLSNQVVSSHPNNVVFWKNRVRMLYLLSQADQQLLQEAFVGIKKASELAPTDAKISYNLGVVLGQLGRLDEAIRELERTKKLKPDYRDVYFAQALFYRELATGGAGGSKTVTKPEFQEKAMENMNYILEKLNPNDKQVLDTLAEWK